jgi:hypothetical protein
MNIKLQSGILDKPFRGASISDSFYSPARYYLTLIYLKTDPLKLDTNIFIQAQRHDLTKNLENEVRNQIIALHTTVFERYINDPFKEIYPSQFIKIMDILKINRTDQIKKIRDVIQKIQMVQQQKQTVSQIQELMKLHKKLQLMNVPVQVEIDSNT